jgi:hypothetical protein
VSFLLTPLLQAQVIIRDTVVISSDQSRTIRTAEPFVPILLSSPASIVLPVAGYLSVEYDSAYSLTHAIPTTSRISVVVANRVFPDMGTTARLQRQWTTEEHWYPCTSSGESLMEPTTGYHYARDTTHPATEWEHNLMPGVLPSEEIALVCSTTVLGTGIALDVGLTGPDSVGQTLVWRGVAETQPSWYCNPSYRFIQKVWFSMIFSPDTVVRFSPLDSNHVYPYYPAIRNDTITAGVKKRYMDLEARIVYGDSILRNYSIRVDRPALVDSGGHSHNGNRPMGKCRHPVGSTNQADCLVAQTDNTGVLKFRYLASQFGGVERIRARLVSDTTKFDTVSILTRVPGLVLLSDGDTNYIKTGGTCDHHGPRSDTLYQSCRTPDNNHWISSIAADSLARAAYEFLNARWNVNREKMRLNDIGLPHGGLFDINGQWLPAHVSHRTGQDVDIENRGRLQRLREVLETRRWTYIPEGPTFFPHFRFE